jgi:hypothetical protein
MLFVDREREARRIAKELAGGHHVIVTGPYGIGRTSLLRKLSESTRDRYRFVFLDFERPVAEMCRFLFVELFPRRGGKRKAAELRSSGVRFRIATWRPEDPRRHVLVLDNVARLSHRKLGLIGDLAASKRYALVAIVESFLPAAEMERIRGRLAPAPVIRLGRLSDERAREYFALASQSYGMGWTRDRIAAAAAGAGGYPLGMWEAVTRERQRRS